MRWFVETSSVGKADSTERACIEAAGWQQALQDVRARRGDEGSFASFSIELMDEGYRAIDPTTRTRFVITRAPDDAPLTAKNGASKVPASGAVAPASTTTGSSDAPRSGATPEPPRVKPRVSIPDDPVPARMNPPKPTGGPPASAKPAATAAVRPSATPAQAAPAAAQPAATPPSAAPAAAKPSAAPAAARASAPPGGGATRILVAHRVASERAIEPSASSPLIYREMALVVAEGTTHDEILGLLRSRFESVRRTLEGKKGRYVVVAVFDHTFEGKPKRLPVATLSWKDWRGDEPEIHFVDEEAPASVVANMGLHGLRRASAAPPRPEPAPSAAPRSPDSIKRAAASMAGDDEATIVRASDPPPQARPSRPGSVVGGNGPTGADAPPTVRSAPPAATLAAAAGVAIPPNPVPVLAEETEPPVEVELTEDIEPEPAPAPPRVSAPAAPPHVSAPEAPPVASAPPVDSAPPVASAPPIASATPASASAPPRAASVPPPSMTAPPPVPQGERIKGDELLAELFEASGDLELLADALDGADFVLDLALQKLPCEVGIVSFFDINRREFVLVRQRGGTQKALLASLPERSEVAHRAMRTGHAVVVTSPAPDDTRWRAMGVSPRSAACAPVVLGGRYLGLIELANPLDEQPLDAADGNALGYLGQQLAEFLAARTISLDPSLVTKPPLRSRMR